MINHLKFDGFNNPYVASEQAAYSSSSTNPPDGRTYIYCTGSEDSNLDSWSDNINDAHVHQDSMCANMCVAKSEFKNAELIQQ